MVSRLVERNPVPHEATVHVSKGGYVDVLFFLESIRCQDICWRGERINWYTASFGFAGKTGLFGSKT